MATAEQDSFEARLRAQIEAYHEVALLHAAVRLGLPDMLAAGPLTAEQLAAALGLSTPHLTRFLHGLCTIGICEERPDGAFALSPSGHCLKPDSPSRLDQKVQIVVEHYWRPWAELVSTLQTGTPAFDEVFGKSVSEWRRDNAAQGALFESYLAKETRAQADDIIAALDMSGVRTVAEIGGGYGGLLAAILQAYPQLKAILFERPHIIAAARPFLQSQSVAERVQLVGGDLLTGIPIQADLYLLEGALQNWDDDAAGTILANCRSAMKDGARLVIVERLLPERATDDPAAVMLDLHMMAITGGRARRLAEFEALLADARLSLAKVSSTTSGLAIIEAVRR
jgi:hypothetical protein